MTLRILVRGSNDIGSAVAYTLFCAGYAVVINDHPRPTVTRRKMAFVDAIFDGQATLEGVDARLVKRNFLLRSILVQHRILPVTVSKFESVLKVIRPNVLVDARMRKHTKPDRQIGLAALTIGLGPNFFAGVTTDLAVETSWGGHLGRVIDHGATLPLLGEPKDLGGHARGRYVYAPIAGTLHTSFQPGDRVEQGQEIARIDDTPLLAPLTGVLRGITHDGVPVGKKIKVIEVDPRGTKAQFSGITERPAMIARGVLQTIQIWESKNVD